MTIDEAISFCNEKSKNIKLKAEPQTFIEIAEWLEDYKKYKEQTAFISTEPIEEIATRYSEAGYCDGYEEGKKVGYNKAIDDVTEYFNNLINKGILNTSPFIVKDYLEQIKK